MMTFSSCTSGSTQLGGRQEIGTFGFKSSVRQCSTLEFANEEEEIVFDDVDLIFDRRKKDVSNNIIQIKCGICKAPFK